MEELISPRPRPYPPTTYAMWRKYVLERDNFVCQICQKPNSRNAHHIKSFINHPTIRLDVSNGKTLCKHCHNKESKERRNAQ